MKAHVVLTTKTECDHEHKFLVKMSLNSDNSLPHLPDNDSPGSSVSSSLQKEYEELLKYAVVTPKIQFPKPVYQLDKDSMKGTNSSSESNSNPCSLTTTSSSSQSTYSEDLSTVAREDVKQLPGTPMVSFQGQGSVARDSLLREGSGTTPIVEADAVPSGDSLLSDRTEDSPRSEQPSPAIDGDLVRMEGLLDTWCLDLKRSVLAEMAQSKMGMYEKQKQAIIAERRRHGAEMNRLLNELESMKELLLTFELTVGRKDAIISNLTSAMQKQKDKSEMLKRFCSWKIKHSEQKSESFGDNLARKHYRQTLRMRAWNGWRSVIESKWKERVEKACQSKSQEVCIKLTGDYEQKLETANLELEEARTEIAKLHAQRDMYEETMKKAFMRGVCALNLEAMTMFGRDSDDAGAAHGPHGVAPIRHAFSDGEDNPRASIPRPTVTTSGGTQSSITTHRSAPVQRQPPLSGTTGAQRHHGTGRSVTVKAVGRSDLQGQKPAAGVVGTQGPVSSILVERHDPQTSTTSVPSRKDPSVQRPTSSRTTGMHTRVTRPGVQTVHTTPLKVVH